MKTQHDNQIGPCGVLANRKEAGPTQVETPSTDLYGWMRQEIGSMPFLQLATPQQDRTIWIKCRSLYGKSYRNRMITSAKAFCEILRDEFQITAIPSQTPGMEDSLQLPLNSSSLQMKGNFCTLREMMEEIIQ